MSGALATHPHFVLARWLWDAIALGDATRLRELLSEDSVWSVSGRSSFAGSYVGSDAILDYLARVGEATDELRSELREISVGETGGVIRYRLRAVRGLQTLDSEQLFVFEVSQGRVAAARIAPVDSYAYDRFFMLQ